MKIGDSGYSLVSSEDLPHKQKARELRPLLNEEMHKLSAVLKTDLDGCRSRLRL